MRVYGLAGMSPAGATAPWAIYNHLVGLRIGIDVGGTFTHGVVLEPPGGVIARARTPTTHADPRGVAAGVEAVLTSLLAELAQLGRERSSVELVAHSTTQATNALLEGDLAPVEIAVVVPPGEDLLSRGLARRRTLPIGGGHGISLTPWKVRWEDAFHVKRPAGDGEGRGGPAAIVQPLAGKLEVREAQVAQAYRDAGRPAVCASEITQVLGLAARTRTAVVNAAMLPAMLTTADFTEQAVARMLPGVPLQVVRSDGGAMSIAGMRRQPILSLLSGPAAGASAALHLSGLADAVFIEVGGTSTDITLIKDGRVRHRYATVGGQRLMVPALDLRTVGVGGGSMLRADKALFGPRSAHIAGLPYLFQSIQSGLAFVEAQTWREPEAKENYIVAQMSDGSSAAFTLTDLFLVISGPTKREQLGIAMSPAQVNQLRTALPVIGRLNAHRFSRAATRGAERFEELRREETEGEGSTSAGSVLEAVAEGEPVRKLTRALIETCSIVAEAIREIAASSETSLEQARLVAGGGGGPVLASMVAGRTGMLRNGFQIIPDHAVISAIGAALAVTCVSLSRNVTQPSGADIAALVDEVEAKLAAQGAERVSTDYEFDPRRQVLTVTGRGSRPYEQDARVRSEAELLAITSDTLNAHAEPVWHDQRTWLWRATDAGQAKGERARAKEAGSARSKVRIRHAVACATDTFGRILWQGKLDAFLPAPPGGTEAALADVVARFTQHTDGGALLPGLGLLTGGRYIPLDQLGDPALIAEVLRWEKLPADAQGCFLVKG